MGRAHVDEGRDSAAQPFGGGEAGGRRVGFGRVRAFEGPDAALEPVHEFHFVGQPPEQRLRDVHMALDEARDDDAPGKVDPFRAGVFRASGQPRPHVRDDAVFDEYVRVQDVPRGVHGDDGCVGEQCAHVFSPVVDRGVTLWLAGLMSGGGGCPEAGTQGSLPGSAVRRPSRKYSGWRGVRKGAGRTLPGGPYSAYYAVSCDNGMCVPLPCGAGPARFPCWHSEAAAPFFSLRPIASAVYRVVILSGSLAASSPEPQARGFGVVLAF